MTRPNRVPARFEVGDRVQVLDLAIEGHIRTPAYIRGKHGTVIQFCGFFLNPEDLSVGITSGPVYPLYRVSFSMSDIWSKYDHEEDDELCIEVYDHWLASSEEESQTAQAEGKKNE